jgi:hypothetical protein
VVLRNVLPIFVRHPDRFPSSAAFCHAALRKALPHEDVCRELAAGTIMLTGGFLLNILNGDPIFSYTQDLDICVVDWVLAESTLVTAWIPREVEYGQGGYDGFTVVKYRLPVDEREVDLIIFEDHAQMRGYLHQFDLSFCANSLSANRLVICDLSAVVERKTQLWTSFYLQNRLASAMDMDALRNVYEHARDRVAKYRLRGYEISVKQDHERVQEVLNYDPTYADESVTPIYALSYGEEAAAWRQHQDACVHIRALWSKWWREGK